MSITPCVTTVDPLGRETVKHGTPAFPIGCYYDDLRAEPVPWHWHEELEAAIVTEGETLLHVENQQFHLHAGDGFFINSGYLHACDYIGPGPCRFHSMSFHARLVGGNIESVFWNRYMQPLLDNPSLRCVVLSPGEESQQKMLSQVEAAWQAYDQQCYGYEFAIRQHLSSFVLQLSTHLPAVHARPTAKTLREDQRIKQMMRFMQTHCAENMTVEEIAASAGISKSEALRVFHHTIGMTPIKYLKFLRIQKAAHLLSETDRKIIDIGVECGFTDMSYFSRVFREEKGSTPGEYRAFAAGRRG